MLRVKKDIVLFSKSSKLYFKVFHLQTLLKKSPHFFKWIEPCVFLPGLCRYSGILDIVAQDF